MMFARPTPAWTEERTQELRSHIRAGLSTRQIADAMGVTRNAVIGKRNRLEPESPSGTPWSEDDFKRLRVMIETRRMTPTATAIALGRSPEAVRSQCRKLGIKWRRLEPNRKIKRAKTIGNDSGGMAVKIVARHGDYIHREGDGKNDLTYGAADIARVSIADLEPHHCRWPIGNPKSGTFGYCGCQRENALTPYCEEHHKRASNGRVRAIDLMRG